MLSKLFVLLANKHSYLNLKIFPNLYYIFALLLFTFRGLVVHTCNCASFFHVDHGTRRLGPSHGGLFSSVLRPSFDKFSYLVEDPRIADDDDDTRHMVANERHRNHKLRVFVREKLAVVVDCSQHSVSD